MLVSFPSSLLGPPFNPPPSDTSLEPFKIFTKPSAKLDCEFNLVGRKIRIRLKRDQFRDPTYHSTSPWVTCILDSYNQNKIYRTTYSDDEGVHPLLYPRLLNLGRYEFEVEVSFFPSSTSSSNALRRAQRTLVEVETGDAPDVNVIRNVRWYLEKYRERDAKMGRRRHIAFGKVGKGATRRNMKDGAKRHKNVAKALYRLPK